MSDCPYVVFMRMSRDHPNKGTAAVANKYWVGHFNSIATSRVRIVLLKSDSAVYHQPLTGMAEQV
tara:strand:+ start:180 stop:374 length:195 start_codon:yes stop_codon:yes gene_type:complete